jgi:hypothetical protein
MELITSNEVVVYFLVLKPNQDRVTVMIWPSAELFADFKTYKDGAEQPRSAYDIQ